MALDTHEIIKHETCIDMHITINGSRNQWKIPMKFSKTNKTCSRYQLAKTNKHALDTN